MTVRVLAGGGGGEETDDDFNLVGALIHANGANAGENKTYIDSSNENHTVGSASNNQYQGTFSPFSCEEGKWSVEFVDSADEITVASSSDFGMGTGDFTWEAWIYPTTLAGNWKQLFSTDNYSTGNNISCWLTTDGNLALYNGQGGNANSLTGDTALTVCTWNHVAYVRSSGTLKIYLNGHEVASSTWNFDLSADGILIANHNSSYPYKGYMSNFRIVKGTAVYTGDFTVPTGPLTAITNTKLLCLCSNHFKDKSTSAHTLSTGTGSPFSTGFLPKVRAFSPFARSAAYDPAVHGGSMWVTHDSHVHVSDATDFDFGTADYCIEGWFYPTGTLNTYWSLPFGSIGVNQYWGWTDGGGNEAAAGFSTYPSGAYSGSFSHMPKRYTWNHCVWQVTGGYENWYLNGTRIYNTQNSQNFGSSSTGMYVGRTHNYGTTYGYEGYISDVRITTGNNYNPYSNAATLTVPTAPLTKGSYTKLLLNFTNAKIIDSTGNLLLETIGDTQLDTSVKKFGTASMEFDGTVDRLRTPDAATVDGFGARLGTGDFTIECFVYLDVVEYTGIWQFDTDSLSGNGYIAPVLEVTPTGSGSALVWSTMTQHGGNSRKSSAVTPSASTWYHTAVVRTNGTVKVFVDGTQVISDFTDTTDFSNRDTLTIGGFYDTNYLMNGYIDEFRVTNKARYTSNFTAPTKEFPNR